MRIETKNKNGFLIVRIEDDLGIGSDVSEIVSLVKTMLENEQRNIVLSFARNSYLYTRSISAITQCLQMIKQKKGTLSIVAVNDHIVDILEITGISSLVRIYGSEDEIGESA